MTDLGTPASPPAARAATTQPARPQSSKARETAAGRGRAEGWPAGGSTPGRRIRLGVLADHPIQYQAPLYREIARRRNVDLEVAFLSDVGVRPGRDPGFGVELAWDIDLLGGYRGRMLGSRPGRVTPGALRRLRAWVSGLDALVVHGYRRPAMLSAAAVARAYGIGYLMRCDAGPAGRSGGWRAGARRFVAGAAVRGAAAGLTIGRANEEFYAAFGVPRQVFAPFSVDNARFAAGALAARGDRAARLARLGLPADRPVVVFAAKLTQRKRPLDAVAAVRALGGGASLLVIGDGVLRATVESACAGLPAACAGFVNQAALPAYYALGDVLVLPSAHEPWGLVVNEAMACGLVPVVSDSVGCAPDLVEGVGRIHPTGDASALASCLRATLAELADPVGAERLADRIAARVDAYSLERTADGFEEGARLAVERRHRPR